MTYRRRLELEAAVIFAVVAAAMFVSLERVVVIGNSLHAGNN
jgi:hypothetical protein